MREIEFMKGAAAALLVGLGGTQVGGVAQAADLGGANNNYANEAHEAYVPQSAPHRHFYVRADVGIGRQSIGGVSQQDLASNGGKFLMSSLDDTVYAGAGIGWQLNKHFRVDLTGEYRSTAQIKALDNLTGTLSSPDGTLQANTLYQGHLSSYVGLLNAYWDLFSARGFTPYVGAGIGIALNKTSGFTTASSASFTDAATGAVTTELANGTSAAHSQTNLAWALMAGTSYDISQNAKLDIGYRYLNLGSGVSATSSLLDCACGTVGAPLKMSDLDAHEIRIGIRWTPAASSMDAEYRALK